MTSIEKYPSHEEFDNIYKDTLDIFERLGYLGLYNIDDWENYIEKTESDKFPNLKKIPIKNLKTIKRGDSVKIVNSGNGIEKERFWVGICELSYEKNFIRGIILNKLKHKKPYNFQDEIIFGFHHIYDIHYLTDKKILGEVEKERERLGLDGKSECDANFRAVGAGENHQSF